MIAEHVIYYLGLLFLRNVAFVFSSAFWGTHLNLAQVKILLAVILTGIVFSITYPQVSSLNMGAELIVLAIGQVLVGLFFGFFTRFIVFVVHITGEWVGLSSGSSAGQIFNPALGENANVFDQFYFILIGMVFFSLNGHHLFIQGLLSSFQLIPAHQVDFSSFNIKAIVVGFQYVIEAGIKLALPVVLSVFVVNMTMGVLARVVPQLNIFVTSLQVNFITALLVLIVSLPFLVDEIREMVQSVLSSFLTITGGR